MKIWRLVLGIMLLALGIAGWALPILPGWIFFFIGLSLLGVGSTSIAKRLKRKVGVGDMELSPDEIHRLPNIYRNVMLTAIVLLQFLIFITTELVLSHPTFFTIKKVTVPTIVYYVLPLIATIMGIVGLFVSSKWQPEDMDKERDNWELYFTMVVIGLPIFWALMLYLLY